MLNSKFLSLLGALLLSPLKLSAAPVIRLVTIEAPPFMSENLPEQGAAIYALRQGFKKMGYDLEITFAPFLRAKRISLQKKDVSGYFPISENGRSQDFMISKIIYSSPWALAERKKNPIKWTQLDDLRRYKIGNVIGYDLSPAIQKSQGQFQYNIETVSSDELNLLKLAKGRIDLAFIDATMFEFLLKSSKQLLPYQDQLQLNPKFVQIDNYGVAFKKTPETKSQLEKFNRVFSKEEFNQHVKTYYSKFLGKPIP